MAVGGFSVLTNILMLAGPLFMLQARDDRVLVRRSLPTLAGLLALLIGAYAFQGLFDIISAAASWRAPPRPVRIGS